MEGNVPTCVIACSHHVSPSTTVLVSISFIIPLLMINAKYLHSLTFNIKIRKQR